MNTWEIESVTLVPNFLAAIAAHLPAAHTVSFEIHEPCQDARRVFAKHHSPVKFGPLRDTAMPKTQLHYCIISQGLADDLEQVLHSHDIKKVLWHVKGFGDKKMLFSIHDADMAYAAHLSGRIESDVIEAIGAAMGRKPIKLQTGYDWDKGYRPE